MKLLIKSIIQRFGFDITRLIPQANKSDIKNFYHECDETFMALNRQAIQVSGSPHDPNDFPFRLYNTLQFFLSSLDLDGEIAECGCFKGRSSYLFCQYVRLRLGAFDGAGYHIFDSFQGISQPQTHDQIPSSDNGAAGRAFLDSGAFAASLEHVKTTLKDFPKVQYHPGWIPDSFQDIPDHLYKFVHLDLDLYEPIRDSLAYFYPRLASGGIIVVDEYALPRWPGAKQAVDEFCHQQSITPMGLTTGNGVIIKR